MSFGEAALGAVLLHDFELASEPAPMRALVERLFGVGGERDGLFEMNYLPLKGKGSKPAVPLNTRRLTRWIARGRTSWVRVETVRDTTDSDAMYAAAVTRPLSDRPERFSQTGCLYDLHVYLGATRVRDVEPRRMIDGVVAFADSVGVRAGIVFWVMESVDATRTRCYMGPPGAETRESYFRGRWGDVIRGPAWGTFLGAHHVERMGGIARVREAPCARVIELSSGGALLEAPPIDAPLVEGRHDGAALAQLAEFLEPVMPPPLPPQEQRGPGFGFVVP